MTAQNDKERLLGILHAHGKQFLSAFDTPTARKHETNDSDDSESEEEWEGFGSLASWSTPEAAPESEQDGDFEQMDDGFAANSSLPDVTVFLEPTRKRPVPDLSAKELRKSFMSSKVSNITLSSTQSASKKKISDDLLASTNAQNDALLHHLLHTKLLSGSFNPELNLDHAQRGRALAGRILELAGDAKLGKGESVFRREQHNKAAKRVRDGLIRKRREQGQKALEEAKNLGNYHPTLRRLHDSNVSSTPKKKRTRGLGMGVGKFVGGTLKLSREEIASVTGPGKRFRDGGHRGKRQRSR